MDRLGYMKRMPQVNHMLDALVLYAPFWAATTGSKRGAISTRYGRLTSAVSAPMPRWMPQADAQKQRHSGASARRARPFGP